MTANRTEARRWSLASTKNGLGQLWRRRISGLGGSVGGGGGVRGAHDARQGLVLWRTARTLVALGLATLSVAGCRAQAESEGDVLLAPGTLGQAKRIALAETAITSLDVREAAELLEGTQGGAASRVKARLAIYRADCEGALAHLATESARREPGAGALLSLADRCRGATVGGRVVEDETRGIWIRFQDSADEVLAPLLMDVIDQARRAVGQDLGVELPRPLRLDLVRDLFSLSAVSGLPVDAAETTGTVAVARWGRVTMLSPRATRQGYPWADTLAHELTHLMLSRASLDRAPLWLQEGIAKREEELWRKERPFDRSPDPRAVAAEAQASGRAVGVTQLGPSIAMLPSADAAAIAFAEVSSFMGFWMERNGRQALPLLLRDLAAARDADSAMRSVSGLSVADWEVLFRQELAELEPPAALAANDEDEVLEPRELARKLRLIELFYNEGHFEPAVSESQRALEQAPHIAAVRFFAERAALRAQRGRDGGPLGELADVRAPHGGWLALKARALSQTESNTASRELHEFALALDPLLLEVACSGRLGGDAHDAIASELSESERRLCEHVRSLPHRGSR